MTIPGQTISETRFVPATSMSALVNEELRLDSYFHPNLGGITQGGMSNHYPMTILSLHGLGASDEEVEAFRSAWPRYRARIDEDLELVDSHQVRSENWTDYLGQPCYLLEFRRVFYEGLEASINQPTYIASVLEVMCDALPMGLFHPLIRLSFACMHGDNGLIADALAYMAIRYFDLYRSPLTPTVSIEGSALGAGECWARLNQSVSGLQFTAPQAPLRGGSLHICEQLCAQQAVQNAALSRGFDISEENLEQRIQEISLCAIRLYLFEPALTTLHAVTGCQALADLTLRCTERSADRATFVELWRRYWVWLTGLYLEKGHPPRLPVIDPAAAPGVNRADWRKLAADARKIPEVHLIKMAFSCKWLYENVEASAYYKLAVMNILVERNPHPVSVQGLVL